MLGLFGAVGFCRAVGFIRCVWICRGCWVSSAVGAGMFVRSVEFHYPGLLLSNLSGSQSVYFSD